MKHFFFLVVCIGVGGALAYGIVQAISALFPFTITSDQTGTRSQLDYADFISIMLTGVTVILAALGFVVALLAFVGWKSIGERVSSLVRTYSQEAMKEGGSLHELVKSEAKSIIYRGIEPVDIEFEEEEEGTP